MSNSFSDRYNYTTPRSLIQHESVDSDTRTALWNLIVAYKEMLTGTGYAGFYPDTQIAKLLWSDFLKKPLDEFRNETTAWVQTKDVFFRGHWYQLYNLIEFLLAAKPLSQQHSEMIRTLNLELERNLTGYRIIKNRVVPVDTKVAADAIEQALNDSAGASLAGVRHHLGNSLELLANRAKPDYANSVKESISAVEALAELITGEAVLSKALPKIGATGVKVHPAQLEAWKRMYGWASDEDGVRHSAKGVPDVDQATAKYSLVTSSAFVSLLIEEANKAGISGLV